MLGVAAERRPACAFMHAERGQVWLLTCSRVVPALELEAICIVQAY